jgi:hypothetical protein
MICRSRSPVKEDVVGRPALEERKGVLCQHSLLLLISDKTVEGDILGVCDWDQFPSPAVPPEGLVRAYCPEPLR